MENCVKIRSARIKKGMPIQDLADALGVTRQTVSMWESGEYGISAANKKMLNHILGIELS